VDWPSRDGLLRDIFLIFCFICYHCPLQFSFCIGRIRFTSICSLP
jgi:hypothetical protein